MMSRASSAILLVAAALVGGCGIQGQWTLKEVRPAIESENFTLARASFYPNNSFEALAVRNGDTFKAKGTYDYCSCNETLTLHMGDETRVYKASRKSCVRLEITETTDQGDAVTAVMRRVDKCDRNADCRGSSDCCSDCCD